MIKFLRSICWNIFLLITSSFTDIFWLTKLITIYFIWLVLSDEQMSKRWPFSLLNDEQMSNWLGVKHLPVMLISKFFYPDLKGHHSSQNARPCASIIRTSQRTSRTTWSFFLSFFVVVVMAEVSRNHLKKVHEM